MPREPHFAIRLDAEDRALLDAVSAAEKLTKSDCIRRALREYARRRHIEPVAKGGKRGRK